MKIRPVNPLGVLRWTLALVLGWLAGGVVLHSVHGQRFAVVHLVIGLVELIGCVLLALAKTRAGALLVGLAVVAASVAHLSRGQAPPLVFLIYAAALLAVASEDGPRRPGQADRRP